MDVDTIEAVFVTIGVVALAFGIFVAIRNKSVGIGVLAFIFLFLYFALALALAFGVFGGGAWLIDAYRHYVPWLPQIIIDGVISVLGFLAMGGVFIVRGRRSKKIGDLVVHGQTKNGYLAQGVIIFLYTYLMLALFFNSFSRLIGVDPQSDSVGNNFLSIVAICFVLYWYYTTEWRGSGFVYRGKVIPFTDVVHARWEKESLWAKAKLNVKLKNGNQELAFIVPAEMVPAIDKYLRAFFPTP